jgi:hypothetical protein
MNEQTDSVVRTSVDYVRGVEDVCKLLEEIPYAVSANWPVMIRGVLLEQDRDFADEDIEDSEEA